MKRKRKIKKKFIIFSIIGLIVIIGIVILAIFLLNKNSFSVKLVKDLDIEINTEVKVSSLIDNIDNGELVDDITIDTSKLGKKDVKIKIDVDDKEEDYSFKVNIVDTIAPELTFNEEVYTSVGSDIDLVDNVTVSDNSKEEIEVTVLGDYDVNTIGEYELSYVAKDSSGNETKKEFTLVVEDNVERTSKGYVIENRDGVTYIDGLLVVNKTYSLPSWYGDGLTSETQSAFNEMEADASALGLNIYISSGYRSYSTQDTIYNNYVAVDGQAEADTYSARAGYSEHQTGLAFDLNSIDDSFTYTDEGKWVNANCYKYGFIIRYPKGKDDITGYMHESWHLRYVGEELATKLYNDGDWITLEEYFGITSKYQ